MIAHRGYLLDVTDREPNRRLMEELVDILVRYGYNEFFLFRKEKSDAPEKLRAYCTMQGVDFAELGPEDYERILLDAKNVIVPTHSARSLAGRIEEMRQAMGQGELAVRSRKATRFLVTDFSDGYAWQPLAVSLPAIILGGNLMMSGASAAYGDLEKELCSVMNLPLGGLLQKLGTLYLRGGARRSDSSEFFNILSGDCGYSRHPGLTDAVLEEVAAIAHGVRLRLERFLDRNEWAAEIDYVALLMEAACRRRHEPTLRAARDAHGRIWRLRYEDAGRVASLAKLPRF